MIRKMEKEFTYGKMALVMKAISRMTTVMVMGR